MNPVVFVPQHSSRAWLSILVLAAVILTAASMVILSTPFGIGASPDSATYIGVANNLLQGKGLTVPFGIAPDRPLTHYPPFYPVALAFSGLFNPDISQSARWLQGLLFCLNGLVWFGFLCGLLKPYSWSADLILLPLIFTPGLVNLHVMAWSEGLFLLVGFGGLFITLRAIRQASLIKFLIAGILLALATLTRYAGVSLLAAAVIGVLILSKNPFRQRIVQLVALGLPGITALIAWVASTASSDIALGNRVISMHFPPIDRLIQGLNTISTWLLIPVTAPSWIKVASIILVVGFVIVMALQSGGDKSENEDAQLSARLLLVFGLVYGLFLLTTLTFVDANMPLDDRIMAPILVSGCFGLVYAIRRSLKLFHKPFPVIITLISLSFGLLSLWNNMARDFLQVTQAYDNGIGFNSQIWRNSPSIKALSTLPGNQNIVSNSPEMVYLLTNRKATPLPRRLELVNATPNPNFDTEMLQLKDQISKQKMIIVYFKNIPSQVIPDFTDLRVWFGPETVIEQADGWLMAGGLP